MTEVRLADQRVGIGNDKAKGVYCVFHSIVLVSSYLDFDDTEAVTLQ